MIRNMVMMSLVGSLSLSHAGEVSLQQAINTQPIQQQDEVLQKVEQGQEKESYSWKKSFMIGTGSSVIGAVLTQLRFDHTLFTKLSETLKFGGIFILPTTVLSGLLRVGFDSLESKIAPSDRSSFKKVIPYVKTFFSTLLGDGIWNGSYNWYRDFTHNFTPDLGIMQIYNEMGICDTAVRGWVYLREMNHERIWLKALEIALFATVAHMLVDAVL